MADINTAQILFGIFFAIFITLIIDRVIETYQSFDTYSVWRGNLHALRRLVTGWIVIAFLPLLQFAVIMVLLNGVNITLDMTISDIIVLVALGFLAFFTLGYYRLYEAIIYYSPSSFYQEGERPSFIKEERQEFLAHLVPGLLYSVSSIIFLRLILLLQGR